MDLFTKPTPDARWPYPGTRLGELEWKLRHETPSREDHLAAAAVLVAYRELVLMSESRRRPVLRALRRAARQEAAVHG